MALTVVMLELYVQCTGNEVSIFSCTHNSIGSHNCGHCEDTGIVCLEGNLITVYLLRLCI